MDLQLFYRDTEQADAWMTKQEVRTCTKGINPCHAEKFYELHSPLLFILLTCIIPALSMTLACISINQCGKHSGP